jgi:hypothetical protein
MLNFFALTLKNVLGSCFVNKLGIYVSLLGLNGKICLLHLNNTYNVLLKQWFQNLGCKLNHLGNFKKFLSPRSYNVLIDYRGMVVGHQYF